MFEVKSGNTDLPTEPFPARKAVPIETEPSRTIGAAYTGAASFRQSCPVPFPSFLEVAIGANNLFSRGFYTQALLRSLRPILAIRHLTGCGVIASSRSADHGQFAAGPRSEAIFVSLAIEQPTMEAPRPQPPRPARPVRQAPAADHPAGHDRRNTDLRPRDRQFSVESAERSAGGREHRSVGAGCSSLWHGARTRWHGKFSTASAPVRSPSRWVSSAGCSPVLICRRRSIMTSTCAP